MKCTKLLLVCLVFQTSLIISDAGRNSKPNSQSPRFSLNTRGTSPGRVNSGRLSPSGTYVGRTQALGAPIPNSTPVRPGSPRSLAGSRPQTPGHFAGPGPQNPGHFAGSIPQNPGNPAWSRPQNPGNPAWPRSQNPGHFAGPRPQNPGNSAGPRPQNPGNSAGPGSQNPGNPAWPRSQNPGHFAGPRPQNPGNSAGPRPQNPGNPAWPRSQNPGHFAGPRPQNPGNSAGPRPQNPGNSAGPRPQNLGNPAWPRSQNPGHFAGPRPQSSHHFAGLRPQTSGSPVWPRSQTSVHVPSSVSSDGHPQYLPSNDFPALGPPDSTFQPRQNMLGATSSSSISSTGSGSFFHTRKPSLSSQGSVSSGYGSSTNLQKPVGLNVGRSTAIQRSIASAKTCMDSGTMPVVLAPAENCFDYFVLAVSWAPGYAYKQWKNGKDIRVKKVSPSWIIHGLWPTMFDRMMDPMPTCRRSDISFNLNRFTTSQILSTLDNTWYTILAKGYSDNKRLWEHEFKHHGSCASRSSVIEDDVNYFKRTIELVQQLSLGMTFAQANYKVGSTTQLREIIRIMENKLQVKIKVDYVVDSLTGENYLSELYVCYDINLRLMNCPNSALSDFRLNTDIKLVEKLPQL